MRQIRKILLCCLLPLIVGCGKTNTTISSQNEVDPRIANSPDATLVFQTGVEGIKDAEGNAIFRLEEFGETTDFKIVSENSGIKYLYYGNTLISDNLYVSNKIYALDANKDGYRDLLFDRKRTDNYGGNRFVIFDVHNNKVLLDEDDLGKQNHRLKSYQFNYTLLNGGKIRFEPYLGNYSLEESVVDYCYLNYRETSGVYFEWMNRRCVQSLELVKFTEGSTISDTNPVVTPTKVNNVDQYTFSLSKTYIMEVKLSRVPGGLNGERIKIGLIEFYREDMNKVYWNSFEPIQTTQEKNKDYIYHFRFQLHEEYESRTWEFFYIDYCFNVNTQCVA